MSWPRRLTALGGGGAGESLAPDSACACVTTGGGTASASIPTGGSLCACVTVSGGIAGTLAACLCATVSGGTVDAQVTCAALTASGGAATPRVACVCATVSGGVANAPTTCVCATVSGGTANAQVSCRCATQSGGTATGNTSLTAFANGYAARRRVVLEAMPDLPSATLTDFPQPIPGALLAGLFKDAAHGGKVQSSAGWDIRVETGGDNSTGGDLVGGARGALLAFRGRREGAPLVHRPVHERDHDGRHDRRPAGGANGGRELCAARPGAGRQRHRQRLRRHQPLPRQVHLAVPERRQR
jgi:hypothetical protein